MELNNESFFRTSITLPGFVAIRDFNQEQSKKLIKFLLRMASTDKISSSKINKKINLRIPNDMEDEFKNLKIQLAKKNSTLSGVCRQFFSEIENLLKENQNGN